MSAIRTKLVEYQEGDSVLEAFVAYPADSCIPRLPCILVAHSWVGRDEFFCQKAEELARLGYVGFALDVYGKGQIGGDDAEKCRALIQPFLDDRALLLRRLIAALNVAKELPYVNADNIGAIGYCFGGIGVLDMARALLPLKGVVSFHGILTPPKGLSQSGDIAVKVLVLHGYDDSHVPPSQVVDFCDEMTARKADWQLVAYGGTQHGFTDPAVDALNRPGVRYNKCVDKRSWQAMKDFFNEVLK